MSEIEDVFSLAFNAAEPGFKALESRGWGIGIGSEGVQEA